MATMAPVTLSGSDQITLEKSADVPTLNIAGHQYRLPKTKAEFQQVKQSFKKVWTQLDGIDDPASFYGGSNR
jgi:hypothetical protein